MCGPTTFPTLPVPGTNPSPRSHSPPTRPGTSRLHVCSEALADGTAARNQKPLKRIRRQAQKKFNTPLLSLLLPAPLFLITHCVSALLSRAQRIWLDEVGPLPLPGLVDREGLQVTLAQMPLRMNEIITQLMREPWQPTCILQPNVQHSLASEKAAGAVFPSRMVPNT